MRLNGLTIAQGYFKKGPLHFVFESPGLYHIDGSNGAGKSTLLKTIMKRLRPLSGSIEGRPERLAYAGIEGLLFHEWTVEESCRFMGALYHEPLALTSPTLEALRPVASYRIRELSRGWKQMTEALIALSLNCELTLLDEPFEALDGDHASLVMHHIKIKSEDSLVLISDHRGVAQPGDLAGRLLL